MTISRWLRLPLATVAMAALAAPLWAGCNSGLDKDQCMKLRVDAFDLVNKAQHCNNDADCRQSDWPGCAKPVSSETYGKVRTMKESFTKGKCEEPKPDCREAPEAYCKQGLCVAREKGTPEGAGNTPADQIIIH